MEYFSYSQEVKKKILGCSEMIRAIGRALGCGRGELPELIEAGESNKVYRLGELEAGLWVALRVPIPDKLAQDLVFDRYEFFCQKAEEEKLSGEEYRVPKFCVGVTGGFDESIGILMEDFTEGGRRSLICGNGFVDAEFADNPKEKVRLDFDNLYDRAPPIKRYFKKGNVIQL
jgi:hypothetical protein